MRQRLHKVLIHKNAEVPRRSELGREAVEDRSEWLVCGKARDGPPTGFLRMKAKVFDGSDPVSIGYRPRIHDNRSHPVKIL
jgi:hypothetical protein